MYPITFEDKVYLPGEKGQPISKTTVVCAICKAECKAESRISPGYAMVETNGQSIQVCYTCAAELEKEWMVQTGQAILYLDTKTRQVTNWTGRLSFNVRALWSGRHNWQMVNKVTFVRFIGPDGKVWAGRHLGDSDLIHCKRTKIKPENIRN